MKTIPCEGNYCDNITGHYNADHTEEGAKMVAGVSAACLHIMNFVYLDSSEFARDFIENVSRPSVTFSTNLEINKISDKQDSDKSFSRCLTSLYYR
jgi:hypothetical protein